MSGAGTAASLTVPAAKNSSQPLFRQLDDVGVADVTSGRPQAVGHPL